MSLIENFRNIFKIEDLKNRILYTIGILMVYRVGSYITLPGVDASALIAGAGDASSLLGLFDLFVGGAFSRAGVFALGIMPYITASIIIQLAGAIVPYFQKLQREGEEGRRKITQLTRYGTVVITAFQAIAFSINLIATAPQAIVVNEFAFTLTAMIVLTAGTVFVMWLGERITDRGIGNGISLIIMIGIIAILPANFYNEVTTKTNLILVIIELAALVVVIAAVVMLTQGVRKIPVQYAKRVVGRKVYGGTTQYLPLKVNAAGVMPIIFAQSIMFIPSTIGQFFPENETVQFLTAWSADFTGWTYSIIFFFICVFFTFFYTAIAINPKEMADTMKRQGGFIPGVRPGKSTVEFIDNILTKITLPGSIFLSLVAILPAIATNLLGVTPGFALFYGGTSLLIIVGVALDTLQQIESHLMMRHYDGFMKTGKIKGRRRA
ncbi:MAG: preprotein translocase subunit SecY [Balneola sp.]|jgi:preprotein translocase subunit SecY|nr:preprotein translocase subunit SecY [Balneola sp.]MBO6652257.1 preprotein translocase subunit SecY [Balneola sp.]MBO6712893.1 preprotein translocase subunit SecY [Balneola sp.]MBO6801600.1 preprotein translocase subunit SecY [Balneola sp.]MBO6869407.1 preprotein translocase subunit SecY [Balneola sp.]|tara:strand:- start:4401 stop:5711 length:1311 start_codon:yes stop_codon:yes gene_type:complete